MNSVKRAVFRRVLERNDRLCADVEVEVEGESRTWVALFAESKDNDYDMVMLLKKDADSDIDWYDNNLHAAYIDVTEEQFQDQHGQTHWEPRERFKEEVLSYGQIREQIRHGLAVARKEEVKLGV